MNIAEKKATTVPEVTAPHIYYKSYDEFCTRINALKLHHEWKILPSKEFTQICKNDNKHSTPLFNIYVEENLRFTIRVFNWSITNDHKIYKLKNITLSNLISTIANYVVCTGIINSQIINSEWLTKHFVPKDFDPSFEQQNPLQQSEYYRPSDCEVLTYTKQCNICVKQENTLLKQKNKTLKWKSKQREKHWRLYPIQHQRQGITSPLYSHHNSTEVVVGAFQVCLQSRTTSSWKTEQLSEQRR